MPVPPIDPLHAAYPNCEWVADFLWQGAVPSDPEEMNSLVGWCLKHKQSNALTWLAIKGEITFCRELNEEELHRLAKWLASSPPVKTLELALVLDRIGNDGVTALASALKRNRSLTSLDLIGNRIGDTGATALASALKENRTLTRLTVSDLYRMDGDAAKAAQKLIENRLSYNRTLPFQPEASALLALCVRHFSTANALCHVPDISTAIVDQLSWIDSDTVRSL